MFCPSVNWCTFTDLCHAMPCPATEKPVAGYNTPVAQLSHEHEHAHARFCCALSSFFDHYVQSSVHDSALTPWPKVTISGPTTFSKKKAGGWNHEGCCILREESCKQAVTTDLRLIIPVSLSGFTDLYHTMPYHTMTQR